MKDVKIALFEKYYEIERRHERIMKKVNAAGEIRESDLYEINMISMARESLFSVIYDSDLRDEYGIWKENKEN